MNESKYKIFIQIEKEKGIPDRFLPFTNNWLKSPTTKKYLGYPSKRKKKKQEKSRLLTFEEASRLFERVKTCVIHVDNDMEYDHRHHDEILELCEWSYSYEQEYWRDSDWDQLWAHAFSEDGHLPINWY